MGRKPAGLFGSSGGDEWSGLAEVLSLMAELKGGGKDVSGKATVTAAPSAAPVGSPTPTAGVQGNIQTAPVPPGAPPSIKGRGGSFLGDNRFSLGNETAPGLDTSGYTLAGGKGGEYLDTTKPYSSDNYSLDKTTTGGSEGGFSLKGSLTAAGAALGGPVGAGIGAIGDTAMALYDAFSLDEQEKAQRAQRHLMEQQFEMRQNFNDAYYRYFLPAQAQSKQYAGQQLGKGSENYDYAVTALKGYIEGSAGVFGGQKDWDEVFQDIGADLGEMGEPDATWLESFQNHLQNDTVPIAQQEMVNQILKGVFAEVGIPYHLTPMISQAIVRWGGAMINASKDMRNASGGGVTYHGSI